jgi:hypothetical protein
LIRELVAFADRELKVTGLENSTLAGGHAVLIEARKDLFARARDDAPLRMEMRCCEKADDKYGAIRSVR